MMTKSLHTITAVKRVAEHLTQANVYTDAYSLASEALGVLGYVYSVKDLRTTSDETLRRCVAAVGGK